jgi:alpha-galactosidase
VVPDYDPTQGYELAGFVWFQGFNDYVDGWSYPDQRTPGGYDEYGQLLAQFIRDVRKDLNAPKLPFVIGVMGIDGLKGDSQPPMSIFRKAQAAPASLPEFKGTVAAVQTAPFWDEDLAALQARMEKCWPQVDAKVREEKDESWENKMKHIAKNFTTEEWKRLQSGASNAGYHYLGCAKTFALIGKAFAEATLGMMPK